MIALFSGHVEIMELWKGCSLVGGGPQAKAHLANEPFIFFLIFLRFRQWRWDDANAVHLELEGGNSKSTLWEGPVGSGNQYHQ